MTLQFLETEGKELILLGDTNCDFLKFSRTSDMSCLNNPSKHMQQIYSTYELKQLINKPTRETSQQSTLIDHIATSHINNIVSSGVLEISLSDHYLVYCVRKFRGALKTKHKVVTTRQMKKFNESAFLQDLALIDWSLILQNGTDLNEQVRNWCEMLSMIIEKYAPLRKRRAAERYAPWYTSELSKLSKVRDKIKKAAVKNQSDLLFAAYKQIRNKVTNMNQKLKRDFFSDKIKTFEGNVKETWKTINQMINKRSKTTHNSSLEDGDKDITDSQQIADAMNQYFCNIREKLSSKIPTRKNPLLSGDVKINQHSKIFRFKNVVEVQIRRAMKSLKTSNGFGLDGISSSFLKVGMPVLASSLSTIF